MGPHDIIKCLCMFIANLIVLSDDYCTFISGVYVKLTVAGEKKFAQLEYLLYVMYIAHYQDSILTKLFITHTCI